VTRVRWERRGDVWVTSGAQWYAYTFAKPDGRWLVEVQLFFSDGKYMGAEQFYSRSERAAKRRARQEARRLGGE
jgi:hypothetical protein